MLISFLVGGDLSRTISFDYSNQEDEKALNDRTGLLRQVATENEEDGLVGQNEEKNVSLDLGSVSLDLSVNDEDKAGL